MKAPATDAKIEADYAKLMALVAGVADAADGDATLASAIQTVRGQVASDASAQRWLDYSINTTIEHEYAASVDEIGRAHV